MSTDAPIEFTCPCGKSLKAKPHAAGRSLRCPGCGNAVTVPSADLPSEAGDAFAGFGNLSDLDFPPAAPVQRPADPVAARPAVRIGAHESSLPQSRSYPVLSLIAAVLRVVAGITAVLAVGAMLIAIVIALKTGGGMADPNSGLALAFTVVPMGIGGLIGAAGLLVNAELITLAIHIQGNTLATAHAARRAAG